MAKKQGAQIRAIEELASICERKYEGELNECLGVMVEKLKNDTVKMSQQIISELAFNDRKKIKKTPAIASKILYKEIDG